MTKKTTTFDVDQNIINVTCETKKAETDPVATKCQWTYDLKSWTLDELMKFAARSLVIDAQRLFRKGELNATATVTKATLETTRKPRGPVNRKKQASEFLANMTQEERVAYLTEQGLI